VVAILARDGGRKAEHVARLGAPGYELEAYRGEMVALIDDQMTVIGNEVIDLAVPHEALDQRDVDATSGLALARDGTIDRSSI
jgi:hypothetical protein